MMMPITMARNQTVTQATGISIHRSVFIDCSPTIQFTDGGPSVTSELPVGVAGPPFAGAYGSAAPQPGQSLEDMARFKACVCGDGARDPHHCRVRPQHQRVTL
jgi:hypothetical protein